jgi:hypothetical protein
VEELKVNKLWWRGPTWIKSSSQQPEFMLEPEQNLPEKKTLTVLLTTTQSFRNQLLRKYSSLSKLCRIIAYYYRFIERSTDRVDKNISNKEIEIRPPNARELKRAENVVLRWIQEEKFKQE